MHWFFWDTFPKGSLTVMSSHVRSVRPLGPPEDGPGAVAWVHQGKEESLGRSEEGRSERTEGRMRFCSRNGVSGGM